MKPEVDISSVCEDKITVALTEEDLKELVLAWIEKNYPVREGYERTNTSIYIQDRSGGISSITIRDAAKT